MSKMITNEEQTKQVEDMLKTADLETLGRIIMNTACLKCRRCSGFLVPPIATVHQFGNVCGNCSEIYRTKTLNVELNTIMMDCIVPCLYTSSGCTEKMTFFNLANHQRFCEYKTYRCPLNCSELQHAGSLLTHVQLEHSQELSTLKDMTIPSEFTINFQHHNFKCAFILNSLLFFIKVECNAARTQLHCAILYGGNDSKDFTYKIIKVGSLKLPYELKRNVPSIFPSWNDPIINHCLSIPYEFIKNVSSDVIEIVVEIDEKIKKLEVNNSMLKVLECPICFQFFVPPIYQCTTGHSICSQCRSKVTKCPTCENELGDTRNYSLEAMSESLKLVNEQPK